MLSRRRTKRRTHTTNTEQLEQRALLTGIDLTPIGTYETGIFDDSGAEIVAHDPATQRAFFTNSADDEVGILDIIDPTAPTLVGAIDVSEIEIDGEVVPTGGVNSVAVNDGVVAVAIENDDSLQNGYVGFYDTDGEFLGSVVVGTLPDSLIFTPDGEKVLVANEGEPSDLGRAPTMATGENGFQVEPIFYTDAEGDLQMYSVGAEINGYTPPGVLDGLGAMDWNETTVRVFANHELLNFRGYDYEVSDGDGGTFTLSGARISYFDIDKETRQIVDAGLAYDTIYDANGDIATDTSFFPEPFATNFGGEPGDGSELSGFSRFCSAQLFEAHQFGDGRGLEDTIYITGEEDGGGFNSVGGAAWALDVENGDIWHIPDFGRGAWENITELDTGTTTHVAFILADDSSPFDADDYDANQDTGDADDEAAPLFLYIGEKDADGDFLAQNGLRGGKLYVWVADDVTVDSPMEFNGIGSEAGSWVEIDNAPTADAAEQSQDGSTGFDEYGYPTQRTLWTRANDLRAFQFSRPEDVSTNPENGTEFVMASTGVDTFDVDPGTGNGVDTFGTMYTMDVDFSDLMSPTGDLVIIYDGDADVANRALRSPDNLDWADDGLIYVQEDEAEEDTLSGDEVLFGPGATNPDEAGIVRIDPTTGEVERVATIDRRVKLDPTTSGTPQDQDAGFAGEWESSGILDVSELFGEEPGSLFIFDVQAHGLEDQDDFNADSRLVDGDLVEGGQLLFLQSNDQPTQDPLGSVSIIDLADGVESAFATTVHFTDFDGLEPELIEDGVRLFPGKSVSQDVEPEYIAPSPDGTTALVTLQEANAVAVLDIESGLFLDIVALGTKDHSAPGNGLDPSDRDDGININNWPVYGLYMPDAIASYEVDGETYYVTANEGDDRGDADEDPWGDAVRLKDLEDATSFNRGSGLALDESFPEDIADDDQLGRLAISSIDGDTDGDGDIDQLFSYGSRSFSIWDSTGNLVFDSGDDFEQITAEMFPEDFNSSNDENGDFEGRSDNKGPEPEAVTTGVINGRTFAFVGLERIGGIMVYDVTNPVEPVFQSYVNNRDFSVDATEAGDLGVEDLKFVSAEDSPNGVPLVIASNEVSGTVTVFQISGTVLNDEVLEVLGTNGHDRVTFLTRTPRRRPGLSTVRLITNFTEPRYEDFSSTDISEIRVSTYGGNDRVFASTRLTQDMIVLLGDGNDRARTGRGNDVVSAGGGDDLVYRARGQNVLIGGDGRDRLFSGFNGNTILIGGSTAYDSDFDALGLISDEWSAPRSIEMRVDNLRTGTGSVLDGTGVMLDSTTVYDDGTADDLFGRSNRRDWYFADVDGADGDDDRLFGFNAADFLDEL